MSSVMNTKEFPGRFLHLVLQILITLYQKIRSNSVGEAVYHQQHDVCGKEQDRRLSTTQVSKYAQKGKRKKNCQQDCPALYICPLSLDLRQTATGFTKLVIS